MRPSLWYDGVGARDWPSFLPSAAGISMGCIEALCCCLPSKRVTRDVGLCEIPAARAV